MGSPWRLREGFATSSRALHEDLAGAEGFEKPPRRLREGFAKAPRAPPFGNDSSDNDKPPGVFHTIRLFVTFSVLVANPARGLLDRSKRTKEKVVSPARGQKINFPLSPFAPTR